MVLSLNKINCFLIKFMKRVFLSTILIFIFSIPYLLGMAAIFLLFNQFIDIDYYGFSDGLSVDVIF